MSFQKFLKIAEQNQNVNDYIVKRLSDEQKRQKELFLKERKIIEAANKSKKYHISSLSPQATCSKNEYDPSAPLENSSMISSASVAATGRTDAEYVPTPIPKSKKLSSLMDALEEINGEIPSSEKRLKIGIRIPKIGKPTPNPSNMQRKPGNVLSSCRLLSNSRTKSDSTVSSLPKPPSKAVILANALSKPGISKQQNFSAGKLSAPFSRRVNKYTPSSRPLATNRNHSSIPDSKKIVSLKTSSDPHFRLEKRVRSSAKHVASKLKTINSTRPSLNPSSSGSLGSDHPPRGIAAQYGLYAPSSDKLLPKLSNCKSTISTAMTQLAPNRRLPNCPTENHFNATKPLSHATKNGIPSKRPFVDPSRPIQSLPSRIPSIQPPNPPLVRGIAAQLGVFPSRSRYDDYDDDSDNYESDDSFIDDSDRTSAREYKIARNEIYKTLHFDPSKYAKVSKYDDLSTMESSYRQIEREEKLSLRLGAQEDREDMAWEEERRRRRLQKSK